MDGHQKDAIKSLQPDKDFCDGMSKILDKGATPGAIITAFFCCAAHAIFSFFLSDKETMANADDDTKKKIAQNMSVAAAATGNKNIINATEKNIKDGTLDSNASADDLTGGEAKKNGVSDKNVEDAGEQHKGFFGGLIDKIQTKVSNWTQKDQAAVAASVGANVPPGAPKPSNVLDIPTAPGIGGENNTGNNETPKPGETQTPKPGENSTPKPGENGKGNNDTPKPKPGENSTPKPKPKPKEKEENGELTVNGKKVKVKFKTGPMGGHKYKTTGMKDWAYCSKEQERELKQSMHGKKKTPKSKK